MKLALLFCVIAAFGYGVGAVLQAVGARRTMGECRGGPEAGILQMARQPIFLLGLFADFGSWLISRFSLHKLPLFAVQTILAGSLAVTVLLAGMVLGAHLGKQEKIAVVVTMVGLVIVGVSAGAEQAKPLSHVAKILILLAVPGVAVLGLMALKLGKSVILAVLAGAAFTGSALAARAVHIDEHTFIGIVSEPLIWAVVAYAALALALHAVALMRGHVGPVTAAMWSTEVVVATIIGAALLDDHMRPGWTIPAIAGIMITLVATIVLARSPAQELDHRLIPPPGADQSSEGGPTSGVLPSAGT